MNLHTAKFIAVLEGGFLSAKDLPQLIALDRLCPVLVRCSCGRFTCAAQDAPGFIALVKTGALGDGDGPGRQYIRDVSIPSNLYNEAVNKVKAADAYVERVSISRRPPILERPQPGNRTFDESQCGGVFDGHGVVSDADPGM